MKKYFFYCLSIFTIFACQNDSNFQIGKIFEIQDDNPSLDKKTNIRIISDSISKATIVNWKDTDDMKLYISTINSSNVLYFDSLQRQFIVTGELKNASLSIRGVIDMNCPPFQNLIKCKEKILQQNLNIKSSILITTEISQSNYFIQQDVKNNSQYFSLPSENSNNKCHNISENDFYNILKKTYNLTPNASLKP
jgi:hypothetical protein